MNVSCCQRPNVENCAITKGGDDKTTVNVHGLLRFVWIKLALTTFNAEKTFASESFDE